MISKRQRSQLRFLQIMGRITICSMNIVPGSPASSIVRKSVIETSDVSPFTKAFCRDRLVNVTTA